MPFHLPFRSLPAIAASGLFLSTSGFPAESPVTRLVLSTNDHIAIIGNACADRLQHSGDLETLIHARHPQHQLVIRHLGFAGDEVVTRARSEGFGSPDDWLKKVEADVVFAFFGYNESFRDAAGVDTFRADLERFIDHTRSQEYGGPGATRLVLFGPTAAEPRPDPNFPEAAPLNARLLVYRNAMAEVARARGVLFVDLFDASARAYAESAPPLTVNGVHLRDTGYAALAPAMYQALFGELPPQLPRADYERLRQAVNEKNRLWFSRYRTMDGYNVYGGRSYLKFEGVMNRDTMQREMERRDVMTANRDTRVWAVAAGRDLSITDENLPPTLEVTSNKPGPNPDGTHNFLSGEGAIAHMSVPPGCRVNLFASEEQFPRLAKPVQMAFDTRGRLWVAVWPNYPERRPESREGDSLLVFEDTDQDGRADRCTPFVDDLNCPTGFQFYRDGVILVQAPDVWFLRDTDGDGRADWKERILNGLDSADSHHTANALVLDPGGAIYLSDGVFHRTQVETPWGPPVRNLDAAIYRFEPRTAKFETYIAYGFANPHGRVFDHWGNDLVTDATGNNTYFGPAFSGHLDYPEKHASLREFWNRPSRPCPGTGLLSSRHFPDEFQGNFLNCNVIGFQGIYRVRVREEGSGLWGETLEPPLVSSDDPNFRPTAVDVAPDGSIYFLDWQNPIIGHMQHHIRDPNRDHQHGRVYRITCPERALLPPPPIAGRPIAELLELLRSPEDNVRTRAKIELGARETRDVLESVARWIQPPDAAGLEDPHTLLEALWVHQWHNVVNEPLLRQLLASPEPRARAAAVRVLGYWRDRVSQPLKLLRAAANDPAPRVRLEAVRVASFFTGAEPLAIACDSLEYDTDYYLDYTFNETWRALKPSPQNIPLPANPRALSRVLARLSNAELLKAREAEPVWIERLQRPGLALNDRSVALDALAKARGVDRPHEILDQLERVDALPDAARTAADLGSLLSLVPAEALEPLRPAFTRISQHARQPLVRQAGLAGLIAADGRPDSLWQAHADDPDTRALLLDSILLQLDPNARARFAPLFESTLTNVVAPPPVRHAAIRSLPLLGTEYADRSFQLLAAELKNGSERRLAGRSLMQIPRTAWDRSAAGPLSAQVLDACRAIPPAQRSEADFAESVQLGMELAALLPAAEGVAIRRELLRLGIRVYPIKTVREQMRYDVTRIVVEAGKPFEIRFENLDLMPHNLVIVSPGAREEVGRRAERMPPTPDDEGHTYVPSSPKVIAASRLLEAGQLQTLKLTAPGEPGAYEYVCTYPEHWKVMFGQLLVVKDLDADLPPTPSAVAADSTGHDAHAHGNP